MAQALSEYCIYTIVKKETLEAAEKQSGNFSNTEKRAWVTGFALWQKAQAKHVGMPILFGDAADCSQLIYWGVLTEVRVVGDGTEYSVDRVRKLSPSLSPQDLVLRSTGKAISQGFIRPYAICKTPSFLEYAQTVHGGID